MSCIVWAYKLSVSHDDGLPCSREAESGSRLHDAVIGADIVNDFPKAPVLCQTEVFNLVFEPVQGRLDSLEGSPGLANGTRHAFEARGYRQVAPRTTAVVSVRGMLPA